MAELVLRVSEIRKLKPASPCPACMVHALIRHCDFCSFLICPNRACKVRFDPPNGRAVRVPL